MSRSERDTPARLDPKINAKAHRTRGVTPRCDEKATHPDVATHMTIAVDTHAATPTRHPAWTRQWPVIPRHRTEAGTPGVTAGIEIRWPYHASKQARARARSCNTNQARRH
ncbi:hypothetical protein Taro_052620 [Colocasia esculenta]|uniref:Uncharacterized protein n=1 Tax=Colocasia esculenta TaxID=4460 RepID=A0A843XKA4_COLES|nr:hypothetical protein [Colocasia esculenta]